MARILNCTKLTITRSIQLYKVTGRTADRPRRGRPRDTTFNEGRHLRILHLRNRFLTVTSSAATGLGHVISRHTVRRRVRQHGIRAEWRGRFGLFRADGRTRIYLRAGQETAVCCVQETVPYTLLKHVLCGQIYSPSLWVVLYEITHFTSAVVNCDVLILWVLLSILVFIFSQIIILSKYNICVLCCF